MDSSYNYVYILPVRETCKYVTVFMLLNHAKPYVYMHCRFGLCCRRKICLTVLSPPRLLRGRHLSEEPHSYWCRSCSLLGSTGRMLWLLLIFLYCTLPSFPIALYHPFCYYYPYCFYFSQLLTFYSC